MGVVAIITALLIEQWRPLGERKGLQTALSAWVGWLEQTFNGGEERHGMVAWLVAVLPPFVLTVALDSALYAVHPLLALLFHMAVLYLTLGFRQVSHHFTQLQLAVKAGDIERARALLDQWRGASGVVRTREEVIRLAIEEALLAAPSGAILYRLAALLAVRWRGLGAFGSFAQRAFRVLEWPAVRITAASF